MSASPDSGPSGPKPIEKVLLAGRGGQRLLRAGRVLARAGLRQGLEVSWVPDIGPEGEGVAVVVTVILAKVPVDSPLVSVPDIAIALTPGAAARLHPAVKSGGVLVEAGPPGGASASTRDDIRKVRLPAAREAAGCGAPEEAGMVALGAFAQLSRLLDLEVLLAAVAADPEVDEAAREGALAAARRGADYVRERRYMKERYAVSIFSA